MASIAFPGRLSREDPDLSDRLRRVLEGLVSLHGRTARPVGSEALARDAGIPLSPASIRNALAELEALGLLARTHASAGRIPNARGYAFFVRGMVRPAPLPEPLRQQIRQALEHSTRDVEALLHEASRVLSELTRQLGLAVARSVDDDRLTGLDLASLGERRVLMVLGLEQGEALTLVLELESPLDGEALDEVARVLHERLLGLRMSEVQERMATDHELIRRSAVRVVVRAATERWTRGVATPLIAAGASRIAEQPEFSSAAQLTPVLRALETGSPLDRLMVGGVEGQTEVRIALDDSPGLEACSLVSFALPGQVRAAIGVLGPVRMNYARALAVVDEVGARMADLLTA